MHFAMHVPHRALKDCIQISPPMPNPALYSLVRTLFLHGEVRREANTAPPARTPPHIRQGVRFQPVADELSNSPPGSSQVVMALNQTHRQEGIEFAAPPDALRGPVSQTRPGNVGPTASDPAVKRREGHSLNTSGVDYTQPKPQDEKQPLERPFSS